MANRESHKVGDIEEGSFHDSDIEKWAGSLAKILEDVPQYMCKSGHPGRISRIPENLRELDVKAYEPCFISIGPYHHGKAILKRTERTKWLVLKSFLQARPELKLKDYLNELKSIEGEARSFYSEIQMDSENFLLMLLLDSIYLLSIFFGMTENQDKIQRIYEMYDMDEDSTGDDKVNMIILRKDELEGAASRLVEAPRLFSAPFLHDLFLLENQIPFFVLEKMHAFAYSCSKIHFFCTMKNTIANTFEEYSNLDPELVFSSSEQVHHLLHICHMFFRPSPRQEFTACQLPESSDMFRLGSAVQLYEGGVNFVATSGTTYHSLLDITFSSSGEMVVPCLFVDDNTNSLLRNLIALEQMKYPTLGLHVSAYAVLLLHLITTPEDARLLRRKGIIQHHLASDKEMVHLVNQLSVGLSFDYAEDTYSLKPVFKELKIYSERRVPRWRAWLKHRHFKNPWTTIALVAASIFLLLAFVDTFFSVYSYYVPCHDC